MTVLDLLTVLNNWAAPALAESYDNVGLIVGRSDWNIAKVLVSLDATEAVVEEAKGIGANVILSHHPIWFGKRNHLRGNDYVSRVIMEAIKHDIALIAIHTNLDAVASGVNFQIAQQLHLKDLSILSPSPKPTSNGLESGSGMIGRFSTPLSVEAFLQLLKNAFHCPAIKYTPVEFSKVSVVAICGGAGSFLLPEAKAKGAHAYVTADVKYHDFFDAEGQLLYCDIGHYESEQFTIQLIVDYLKQQSFSAHAAFTIVPTQVNTNPVRYWL
jgi:dinuclear metal center YbgI/SA1388 family protein